MEVRKEREKKEKWKEGMGFNETMDYVGFETLFYTIR